MQPKASPGLESFIDETIRIARERGYNQSAFIAMRHRHGTIDAFARLVVSGETQTGFKRLTSLGLLDWTIEAAVLKFPDEFTPDVRQSAEFRLRLAREGVRL